jgi:tRNA(Ile)-lysidine synthetase-like protein
LDGEFGSFYFGDFKICWKKGILKEGVHNSFNTFCLKCENITGAVSVTSRRDGDRVKLQGHSHTKRLKHLFQERKLTQPQRAVTPVFRDDRGILAIFGFGIAQRCVPEIGDEIIMINCENEREKWWTI